MAKPGLDRFLPFSPAPTHQQDSRQLADEHVGQMSQRHAHSLEQKQKWGHFLKALTAYSQLRKLDTQR